MSTRPRRDLPSRNKKGHNNDTRQRCSDYLCFAAAPVAGALGVAGFLLLAHELGHWFLTGEWTAQPVGLVLSWLGLTAGEGHSWIRNLMLDFPISWLLVLVAPALFSAMIATAERLEEGSANNRDLQEMR